MRPVIFYVDDEPMNLTVFEASMPETWEIHTFDNPAAAIDELERIKPWVVVSDQRMPGMKGVDFLDKVRQFSPHSIRIVATGFSDEQLIIDSVRRAKIFDYIRKPWDSDDLQNRMEQAIDQYRLDQAVDQRVNANHRDAFNIHQDSRPCINFAIACIQVNQNTGLVHADHESSQILFKSRSSTPASPPLVSEIFDGNDWRDFLLQLSSLKPQSVARQLLRSENSSGPNRWFLVHGFKIDSHHSNMIECAVIDVTSMKLAEDKIVRHSEEITKTNDYLTAFANYLSIAASDPIRNLSNYLQLISNQKHVRDEANVSDLVNRALACAHDLKKNMQIIYRLSKLSFANVELDTVCLDAIVSRIKRHVGELGSLKLTIGNEGLPSIWGDSELVFQLFANLLNSIPRKDSVMIQSTPGHEPAHERIEVVFYNSIISDTDVACAFSMSDYMETGTSNAIDRAALILAKLIAERMNGSIQLLRTGVDQVSIILDFAKALQKRSRSSLKMIA